MCNLFSWRLLLAIPWFKHLPKDTIDEILKQSGQVFVFKYPKVQIQSFQLVGDSVISSTDHWGTKPSWCPGLLTNSKSENLIASPFWRKFTKNRILVPVHSFIEWQAQKSGKKHKFEMTFKNPNTLYAGIWGEEDGIRWITILTQTANETMNTIHNSGDNKHRQPIMPSHYKDAWLDPKDTNPNDITDLFYQFAPDVTTEVDHNREETLFG